MATISSEDRARLMEALEIQAPLVQSGPVQDVFYLLLTLLRDYSELETYAAEQAHIAMSGAEDLKKVLAQLVPQKGSGPESKKNDYLLAYKAV